MLTKDSVRKLFSAEKYQVELFKKKGFARKQCSCGKFFWTLGNALTCGDPSCVGGYHFLGKKSRNWSFHDAVNKWCGFFEKNGHKRITEYPVVARWRDDMDFTIASIADFQPWVLNGTVDPPANPLVVPQPCLRFAGRGFNDIDNVGRTGRHFTLFIMGGQHAFNSKKLKGYWMDRCIELNFKFLTKELGIDPKNLTYVEDIWMGGGNFGPCLEVFSDGLELVNNVFMQYQILPNGSYKEMEMKVIDVGWGVDRLCWFSQGTPTAYDAVFGPVLEKIQKMAGISVNRELLFKYYSQAGMLNVEEMSDVEGVRKKISQQIGVNVSELHKILGPLEAIYAIADHTRALMFALADGGLPSNVSGGYNLRTLLRRAASLNSLFKLNLDLVEICRMQIDYFGKTYPRLENARPVFEDIIKTELERYKETEEKGIKLVASLLQKGSISSDKLVELYESHGVSPETVSRIAEKLGKHVEVPNDFYLKIGEMHSKKERVQEKHYNLPDTEKLYYDQEILPGSKEAKFKAKVIWSKGDEVVLNRTLFYPTSGGQLHDKGTLAGKPVLNVEKFGNVIVHTIKGGLRVGPVEGAIDIPRRLSLMRHHSATHIVNAASRRVLGPHIFQAGAEKTAVKAHLDITHYKSITPEELAAIETEANKIVLENVKINKIFMERNEAEKKYGFSIYQGGAVPGKLLRIVEYEGVDVEACGGIHANRTSEVGLIKMPKSERIQDGIVRLTFCAGDAAVHEMRKEKQILDSVSGLWGVQQDQLVKSAERFFSEWKSQQKEIERLREERAKILKSGLLADAIHFKGLRIVIAQAEGADSLAKELAKEKDVVAVIGWENQIIAACGEQARKILPANVLISKASAAMKGHGSGDPDYARGGGKEKATVGLEAVRSMLKQA